MNKNDRKQLSEAVAILNDLTGEEDLLAMSDDDIDGRLTAAEGIISSIAESEREKFDNMPEGLQASERGEAMSEAADVLEGVEIPSFDRKDEDWNEALATEVQNVIDEIEGVL